MIEISCTPGTPVSDFCEADGVVSDCIAELGNTLTGGFSYLVAATLITIFAFRLNFPSKLFLLPFFLACFSISTALFHISLSVSSSFAGTYSLYSFFLVLNLTLIQSNPQYKSWKAYALLSTFFVGSILGDILFYHLNSIRSIDGMFSFGYFLLTIYLLFKFQKAFPEHRTRFFTIRTLMLAQILVLVKLVEALVPCSIDMIGACRWIWHFVSGFVAFYASLCAGLISLEAKEGVSDEVMAFILKNCPFIPKSLRDIYYEECLEDSVDAASIVAARLGIDIINDVTEHPMASPYKTTTEENPEAPNPDDIGRDLGDDIIEPVMNELNQITDEDESEAVEMHVQNVEDPLSDMVTEIDQELDQIEEFLLSIVN